MRCAYPPYETGSAVGWIRRAARCQGPGTAVARAASTKGRALPPKFGIAVRRRLVLASGDFRDRDRPTCRGRPKPRGRLKSPLQSPDSCPDSRTEGGVRRNRTHRRSPTAEASRRRAPRPVPGRSGQSEKSPAQILPSRPQSRLTRRCALSPPPSPCLIDP